MNKKLFIRADASSHIGTGHVMRCLALAQAWQEKGGQVVFISHCESIALQSRIIDEGFDLIPIKTPHPDPSDMEQTLQALKRCASCSKPHLLSPWFTLDGYHFTPEYQKAIRDAGCRLLVIDDMNHLPRYHADIIMNQNIHALDMKYRCDADTTILLGPSYVLLRREFLKYQGCKRHIPDIAKNILVTLGGADPDNVIFKVIEALKLLDVPDISTRIIVGPANKHQEIFRKAVACVPFKAELLINPTNMADLMAWADLAISAAGSTCGELAFMGVPIIALILADNQEAVAEGIAKEGVAVNLDWFKTLDMKIASEEMNTLIQSKDRRSKMIKKGQALISSSCKDHLCEKLLATLISSS